MKGQYVMLSSSMCRRCWQLSLMSEVSPVILFNAISHWLAGRFAGGDSGTSSSLTCFRRMERCSIRSEDGSEMGGAVGPSGQWHCHCVARLYAWLLGNNEHA